MVSTDCLHASKRGSYQSALALFGTITGIDPWSQRVASEQLSVAGIALTRVACLHANARAADAGACRQAP